MAAFGGPGKAVPTAGGKRGKTTKVFVPLLTPQTFLRTRLPSVARLKTRGPQGRLLLQDTALDRSGAFRSRTPPPCTVWPRIVMRGKPRKVNSGPDSVSKPARRTEPSPRNHRFAAHLRCVSAKEGLGESRGGKGTIRCPCPLLFPPVNTGSPGRRRRPLCTLTLSVNLACGGKPPERRNRSPSAEGKRKGRYFASSGAPLYRRKVCLLLPIRLLRICKAFYKGFS